jgi:hypothetical protein
VLLRQPSERDAVSIPEASYLQTLQDGIGVGLPSLQLSRFFVSFKRTARFD